MSYMKNCFKKLPFICLLIILVGSQAQAQKEGANWYFGKGAGVHFAECPVRPVAQKDGAIDAAEGCATISTPNGQLLMYCNGEKVWGADHQMMPNGNDLGGSTSATQGAIILRKPGSVSLYYIFTVDAIENNLRKGLRYSIVDMSLRNGLGDVTAVKSVRLSTPTKDDSGKVSEKLTSALHANGHDIWIVVHGWESNTFYSFLLSSSGIADLPVETSVGVVHSNFSGCMRISSAVPGHLPLLAITHAAKMELYDFDNAKGEVINYRDISTSISRGVYGIEFSPDNSRLYCSTLSAINQYNLLAGSTDEIKASIIAVTPRNESGFALQQGPDGKIYVSPGVNSSSDYLNTIDFPNALGMDCGYHRNAVYLEGKKAGVGLPDIPAFYIAPLLQLQASAACVNTISNFTTSLSPAQAGATYSWNFGDPLSSTSNVGVGPNATHVYSVAGIYTVTVTAQWPGATCPQITTQNVTVAPLPTVSLSAPRQVCQGQSLVLSAGTQPNGTTYLWQDGSTNASFTVSQTGTYSVTVTSPQGCTAKSSTTITVVPLPNADLGPDVEVCLEQPFTLELRSKNQPAGTTYRWQDGSTANSYRVIDPGVYSVEVSNNGCTSSSQVNISGNLCTQYIPNVITPNGDKLNDAFQLKGLNAQAWNIIIFNRWGRQVYRKEGYDNRWQASDQSAGVYYYLLQNPTTGQQLNGWVQVIR